MNTLLTIQDRIAQRLASIRAASDVDLSGAEIASLLENHFRCRNSRCLPALAMRAMLQVIEDSHGKCITQPFSNQHGDVEITLVNEDQVRTIYEMKQKAVTIDDIDRALQKVATIDWRVDNYIFITTDAIHPEVAEYAGKLYERTGGTEFAILDCVCFLRHYLHFFHPHRTTFLNAYQSLVLNEPDSAVSLPLKEVFLSLRQQAEAES